MALDDLYKLVAIEEIKQCKARYWRCMDTKEFDGLQTVFAPDAVFDAAEAQYDPILGQKPGIPQSEPWVTRDVILSEVANSLQHPLQSVHMGHLCEIEITSETTATAIFPFNDRIKLEGVLSFNSYGYYYDTFEKIDGQWMVKTSTIKRLRSIWDVE